MSHELADFRPEDGHLHHCTWRKTDPEPECSEHCAEHLFAVAENLALIARAVPQEVVEMTSLAEFMESNPVPPVFGPEMPVAVRDV